MGSNGEWAAPFNSDVLFRGWASSEADGGAGDGITLAVHPGGSPPPASAKL